MPFYTAVRRVADGWLASFQESPGYPSAAGIITQTASAAVNFGGVAADYEVVELLTSQWITLQNNLPPAGSPMRFYLNEGQITGGYAGLDLTALRNKHKANFRRGYIVRRSFTTVLSKPFTPIWAGV